MTNFEFRRIGNEPSTVIDVPQAIFGILTTLPPPGTPWPDVNKAKFMAALGAVLDVIYPEQGNGGSAT